MTQEQQHLLMTIHSKLVSLKYHGEVTEQLVIRDIASDAIDDLIKLKDLLTSEKEGKYYLTDENAETTLDKLRSEYGSTASEQTDDLGFQEFQNQKQ